MVERIIDFSARNRFIVFLLLFGLATAGLWAMRNTPVDAVPDLSDTQVIIYTTWMGRSPDLVEDQITYPIVTALLSAPKVTVVRGFSDFGYSYVYVLFKDGTDIYWARSRVLEYMNQLAGPLAGGRHAAARSGCHGRRAGSFSTRSWMRAASTTSLRCARSRTGICATGCAAVEGVAEVASVGGFVRQYQVNLDPTKVLAYKLSLPEIIEKIRMSNNDVGGRVVEFSGIEYMIRGRGYIKSRADIEKIAVGVNPQWHADSCCATSRRCGSVRTCGVGLVELDGQGEVVGGGGHHALRRERA